LKLIESVSDKAIKSFLGLLGNTTIIDSTGFSSNHHSFYYDKRLNDFGKMVIRKYVKTTILVDDKSQIIVVYNAHFGEIHDSWEFKKILKSMDKELVNKLIIVDNGYNSEENHIIAKRYALFTILQAKNKDVLIHRTKRENRKRMENHPPEEYKEGQFLRLYI